MAPAVDAASLYSSVDHGHRDNVTLHHDGGLITAVDACSAPPAGPRKFLIPAFINAHDHARPRGSSFGATGMPLETWILRTALGTPVDPYLTAASAFGRAAVSGCAGMMVHYTRPSGAMPLVDEAKTIARAASDVGIRIAFAIAVRDQNPIVYGDSAPVLSELTAPQRKTIEDMFVRTPLSPRAYIELTDAIASAIAGPMVDVQLGPAGVQWCSRPLLEAIAENSALTGRRVHMHLLETVYQRAWADREFPQGIVRYLRNIGFLSERLTLAHCIHARPDELQMIAESGARIVTNFSSNLHLRSGLAPIRAAHACGCSVAIGVDGLALDEDDDILREMRLVKLAHGGLGFDQTWTPAEFLGAAIRNGRRAIGAPGDGALGVGAPADFVEIDLDRLEQGQVVPTDPLALLFARGNSSLVRSTAVAGRVIASDGRCTGIDLPAVEKELLALYKANAKRMSDFQIAWPAIARPVQQWFETQLHCS